MVGPQTGGISETVVNGETGILVPPEDVPAFAAATESLVRDETRRHQFAQNGQKHVEALYTVPAMVERLNALYAEILATR